MHWNNQGVWEKEAEEVGLEESQRMGKKGVVRKECRAFPGEEVKTGTVRGLQPGAGGQGSPRGEGEGLEGWVHVCLLNSMRGRGRTEGF